jgi:hypothetical protein
MTLGVASLLLADVVMCFLQMQRHITLHGAAITRLTVYSDLRPFFAANRTGIYPGPGRNASKVEDHAVRAPSWITCNCISMPAQLLDTTAHMLHPTPHSPAIHLLHMHPLGLLPCLFMPSCVSGWA